MPHGGLKLLPLQPRLVPAPQMMQQACHRLLPGYVPRTPPRRGQEAILSFGVFCQARHQKFTVRRIRGVVATLGGNSKQGHRSSGERGKQMAFVSACVADQLVQR